MAIFREYFLNRLRVNKYRIFHSHRHLLVTILEETTTVPDRGYMTPVLEKADLYGGDHPAIRTGGSSAEK